MSRPTYAEVNLGAIRNNFLALRGLVAPGGRVLALVKGDAYGHGAVPVARVLQSAGVDMLGVALAEEGMELRAGGLRTPILIMGLLPADDIRAAIEYHLAATVDTVETAAQIDAVAAAERRRVHVHLKIDTGMNRLGIRAEEAAALALAVSRMEHLDLAGVYTHLACADCEDGGEPSARQLARFKTALEAIRAAGVLPPLVHAANSAALMTMPEAHFDMVRPGLALYGISPCAAAASAPLAPALELKTAVAHLKRVLAGEGASYGHRWRARRDSLLGLLPIGYADGYPRALWQGGQARVAGRLAPVVGTVCMDTTLIDLTDVPEARIGLPVTLLEADPASPLSAAALAALCHTIPHEILTGLGKRVPRVYVE